MRTLRPRRAVFHYLVSQTVSPILAVGLVFLTISPTTTLAMDPELRENFAAVEEETKTRTEDLILNEVYPRLENTNNHALQLWNDRYKATETGHGSKWMPSEGYYDKHDWYDGNSDFASVWISEETSEIMSDFFECLDIQIIAIIYVYYGIIIIFDYHWPEVVGETNNYAIGSFITGQFRDIFLEIKEELVRTFIISIHTEDPEEFAWHWDAWNELRSESNDPVNLGQTHNDQVNLMGEKARHYEAHLYRTFFDAIVATIASESDDWGNVDCIRQCLEYNPPDDWFPINWSEALLSPVWRFPELSLLRLSDDEDGADAYTDYYEQAALYSFYPGYLYYGTSMSPILRDGGFSMPTITNPAYDISGDMTSFMETIEGMADFNWTYDVNIGGFSIGTLDIGTDMIDTDSMFDSGFEDGINGVFNADLYGDDSWIGQLMSLPRTLNLYGVTHYSCMAYRASNQYTPRFAGSPFDKNPIWEVLRDPETLEPLVRHERDDDIDEELAKICYHQSVQQLYPLVGGVWGNAERVAPITAARRLWEWQSMNMWDDFLRQNYFDDFGGRSAHGSARASGDRIANWYRDPGELDTHRTSSAADWIQRIFPETTGCFTMTEIDERDDTLFRRGMFEEDTEATGNYKIVHWNRRRCLIFILSSGSCIYGRPLQE